VRAGRAGRDALYDALRGCGGICGRSRLRDASEMRWTHSSESHFRGWGVSRTRNFGLWNVYSSELDALTPRECLGDIPLESGGRAVDPAFGHHSCSLRSYSLRIGSESIDLHTRFLNTLTSNHVDIHGAISSHVWLQNSTGSVQLHQVDCPLLFCVGFTQLWF
jgi:hypothetical protein